MPWVFLAFSNSMRFYYKKNFCCEDVEWRKNSYFFNVTNCVGVDVQLFSSGFSRFPTFDHRHGCRWSNLVAASHSATETAKIYAEEAEVRSAEEFLAAGSEELGFQKKKARSVVSFSPFSNLPCSGSQRLHVKRVRVCRGSAGWVFLCADCVRGFWFWGFQAFNMPSTCSRQGFGFLPKIARICGAPRRLCHYSSL